jgi:hypothetical protein
LNDYFKLKLFDMKSDKEKTKSKKKSRVNDEVKIKFNSSDKPLIDTDLIRKKANEIYLQRVERGEFGTAENDWTEAEKFFRES